ncbi:TniB family NTP-binding protein [Stenotrophomonas maltophilia]|uniref:TniB family NTP-binding protein n=1 Tax=Stenotrophomonas maltophilia TaxID=40324 RepID=UPI003BF79D60
MSSLESDRLAVLEKSATERLAFMRQPRWFEYEEAEAILAKLDNLLSHPPTHRMPGMQILGDSNNGKTALGLEFVRRHPWDENPHGDAIIVPVVRIEMPPNPDEKRLYEEILVALRQPLRSSDSVTEKARQTRTNLSAVNCRMLMLDEFQNALALKNDRRRILIDTIKYLSNTLQIPIVIMGTAEAQVAVGRDEQLTNRLKPSWLSPWPRNEDYKRLLSSFEAILPLKGKSTLQSSETGSLIHALSEGLIGETRDLVCEAVRLALFTGRENIDTALIRELDWVAPSRRKDRPIRGKPGK